MCFYHGTFFAYSADFKIAYPNFIIVIKLETALKKRSVTFFTVPTTKHLCINYSVKLQILHGKKKVEETFGQMLF